MGARSVACLCTVVVRETSMRRICCFLLLLLKSLCAAGDAPAPVTPPVAPAKAATELCDLTIADGNQLIAHWNTSIYAKVWQDPALAALRTQFDSSCSE